MFTFIVGGPVDPSFAGIALAAAFICICIFSTVYIASRRSRRELGMQHEMNKIKERDSAALAVRRADQDHEQKMAQLGYRKEVDLAQAGAGLITSHSRGEED